MADQQINFEGTTHYFPSDFSKEDIANALKRYHGAPSIQPTGGNTQEREPYPKVNTSGIRTLAPQGPPGPGVKMDSSDLGPIIGSFIANSMPALGGALATPESFGAGTIPGIAAGSFIKRGLQAISPKYFGGEEGSVSGDLADTAIDIAGNLIPYGGKAAADVLAPTKGNVAKILTSKFLKGSPAIQEAVDRSVGAQAESMITPNDLTMRNAAQNVRENPNIQDYAKRGNKDFAHPAVSEGTVGKDLADLRRQDFGIGNISVSKLNDKALSDVTQVQNFKIATGEPYTIEQLAVNKAIKSGYSGTGRLDPDKILSELNGKSSDVYEEAIRGETRKNLESFLEQAKAMQVDPSSHGGSLLSMVKNKPILSIPGMTLGAALGGAVGHPVYGALAGGATSIVLGESAISKLMANPEIAKLTLQAMKTPIGDQSSKLISQVVLNGLRGMEVYVMTPDGQQEKALVSQDGKLTYPKPK